MGFDGACHMFGPGGVDRQRAIPPPRNRTDLGDDGLGELTMMVAVENQRSRFNAALGLWSQGFSESSRVR